jgi:hypothetical protein
MTHNTISLTRTAGAFVLTVAAVGSIFRQTDLVVVKVADKASPLLTMSGWPLF